MSAASSSSSWPSSSSSKPLNPSAASYEPQLIPINMAPCTPPNYTPLKICLPPLETTTHYGGAPLPLVLLLHPQPQLPPPPAVAYYPPPLLAESWCWYVEGESLSLYNSEKQPHPLTEVVSGPDSGMINYGSDQRVEEEEEKKKIKKMKMKKGQCGFLPPRFRLRRDQYNKPPVVRVPRKSGVDEEKKIINFAPNLHAGPDPLAADEKIKFLDGKPH